MELTKKIKDNRLLKTVLTVVSGIGVGASISYYLRKKGIDILDFSQFIKGNGYKNVDEFGKDLNTQVSENLCNKIILESQKGLAPIEDKELAKNMQDSVSNWGDIFGENLPNIDFANKSLDSIGGLAGVSVSDSSVGINTELVNSALGFMEDMTSSFSVAGATGMVLSAFLLTGIQYANAVLPNIIQAKKMMHIKKIVENQIKNNESKSKYLDNNIQGVQLPLNAEKDSDLSNSPVLIR